MSIAPFSRRNSDLWKPSGSVSRTVCSMTRGPAKPMSAPGSAMTTSPMKAKLADTPPMVGSVRIEMKGWRAALNWCSAAVVLAICMSDSSPSCMRAPPVAVKHRNGSPSSQQSCTARTNRSPTTEPIEPPRKPNSKAAATTGTDLTAPCITTSASVSPVSFSASSRRSLYLRLSLNLSGSIGTTSEASSARPSGSRKRSSRWRAESRLWKPHFGHTWRLFSRSVKYSTASHDGHLLHRPSGTAFFCCAPSRLILGGRSLRNQLMSPAPARCPSRRGTRAALRRRAPRRCPRHRPFPGRCGCR